MDVSPKSVLGQNFTWKHSGSLCLLSNCKWPQRTDVTSSLFHIKGTEAFFAPKNSNFTFLPQCGNCLNLTIWPPKMSVGCVVGLWHVALLEFATDLQLPGFLQINHLSPKAQQIQFHPWHRATRNYSLALQAHLIRRTGGATLPLALQCQHQLIFVGMCCSLPSLFANNLCPFVEFLGVHDLTTTQCVTVS